MQRGGLVLKGSVKVLQFCSLSPSSVSMCTELYFLSYTQMLHLQARVHVYTHRNVRA